MMNGSAQTLKQPAVFKLACLTAMWERYGYYVLSFLLVLYAKGEFGFSDAAAFALYGVFTALAYLSTAGGGFLADNVFGIRRCIILGFSLEGLGLLLLAIPGHAFFSLALALVLIGMGLSKTGPTHLLGRSYEHKDNRIDSGFTLYYMCMNIGSMTSSIMTALLHRYYGWHAAFFMGGAALFVGLLSYFFLRKTAKEVDSLVGRKPLPIKILLGVMLMVACAVGASSWLVSHTAVSNIVLVLATLVVALYFIYEIIKSPKEEKERIIACLALVAMGLVFFVLYQQAYMSILLFINRSVSREIMGFVIPTEAFFSLNPFWVVVLGPVLSWAYGAISRRYGKDVSITVKFPVGLLVTSLSFMVLVISTYFADANAQVSPPWIVLVYFLYTLGEMLVSALGFAMITHIAPKRFYGIMMGTWFLVGMSLSAALSGVFAGIASIPESLHDPVAILHVYTWAILKIGTVGLICTAIAFAVGPSIKRLGKLE